MKKSYVGQLLLAVLFGPLGLFYSSMAAGIVMLIVTIAVGVPTNGVALLVIWPLCVLIGIATVSSHNEKINIENRRHEELVRAVTLSSRGPAPVEIALPVEVSRFQMALPWLWVPFAITGILAVWLLSRDGDSTEMKSDVPKSPTSIAVPPAQIAQPLAQASGPQGMDKAKDLGLNPPDVMIETEQPAAGSAESVAVSALTLPAAPDVKPELDYGQPLFTTKFTLVCDQGLLLAAALDT